MITVVWLLPSMTVTPVVGLTTLSDTVNISFASKILSSLVVMSMHLSVVSVAVNVLVSDTDTKSAAVALMERNHVKDNIAPNKYLPVPNVLVRLTTTLLPKCPVKVTQTITTSPSVTDL